MNQTQNVKLTAEISATSKGLVEALQKASGAINSTSQDWKSKFSTLKDSTSTISQSVKNLADLVSQVGKVDMDVQGMDKVRSNIAEVTGAFSQVKGQVDAFVSTLSALKIAASELGMPIEEYQRFTDAVKDSGMQMSDAVTMVKTMQSNIRDFANGIPEAQELFSKLGISLERLSSNTITGNLSEIARAINDTIPASERATANMQLFKSSIDSTLAVVDQYNKATSRQHGEYASDKDVQNAISLSNAIGMLGERLTTYISKTSDATTISNGFSRSLDDMWDFIKRDQELLAALSVEYANYVESLKSSVTSTLDASKAIEIFSTKIEFLKDDIDSIKDLTDDGMGDIISDDDIQEAADKLNMLENFLKSSKERIKDEIDAVIGIMQQRMHAGAPIDTKELETAINHVNTLMDALASLSEMHENLEIGISDEDFAAFQDLEKYLAKAQMSFEGFSKTAETLNNELLFKEAQDAVRQIDEDVNKLKRDLQNTGKVSIDTRELEKARYELSLISGKKFGVLVDTREVDELNAKVERLKREIDSIQRSSEMGTPVWQPMIDATNRMKRGWTDIMNVFRRSGGFLNGLKTSLRSCLDYVTRFRDKTNEAGSAGKSLGDIFKMAGGQLVGMASKVGVVLFALRQVSAVVQEIAKNIEQARIDRMYGNAGAGADDMRRVREKNDEKQQNLIRKLKEFADLYDEEKSAGSETAKAKRLNLQDELKNIYNFEFDEVNGEIQNMDEQIATKLDELTKKRVEAINAQIKANQRVIDGASEYINSFGYWKRLFTKDDEGKIRNAQERSTRASDENMSLSEQKKTLEVENLRLQFERIRQAKSTDETTKQEEEAQKEAQKAEEEQARILEEANKKLEEWSNSLNDNEREKNLRSIMARYEEAVSAGIKEEDARVVAIQAINAMLKNERDEEEKKNRELLDAVNQSIEQYKNAYRDYANAERAIQDARREYAQTEKDLARENRAERLQKRRDRLQRRMNSFGFTPYDGFRLNESASQRSRRRRNVELDASISDKMARSQAGERVHWTANERDRIRAYQSLQRKDRQLESAQKQMEAAEKQRSAADALQKAAEAIRNAVGERADSLINLRSSRNELRDATRNRMTTSTRGTPNDVFNAYKNGTLRARGASGAFSQRQHGYNQQLDQLHNDLKELNRRVFVVK